MFGKWAIEQHAKTNHMYDINLPYSYHLSLVAFTGHQFKHLVGDRFDWIQEALWGHDLIEDARVSYNDIVKAAVNCGWYTKTAEMIAEAIRSVTNYGRGRNREERMPDWIYDEMKQTTGGVFIKCADRAANLKHGLISGSTMKFTYAQEQAHFKEKLYRPELKEMFDYIDKLIDTVI